MIEDISYIRFRSQSEVQHKDYIQFVNGGYSGCYSQVGRSEKGRQDIKLNEICAQMGIYMIIHEVCKNYMVRVVALKMDRSINVRFVVAYRQVSHLIRSFFSVFK